MILTPPTYASVLYIAERMRASDREEIYALRWGECPKSVADQVASHSEFAWVAWHGGMPCAVIGGVEKWPGTWSIFMFATDAFPAIGLPMTRFVKRSFLPTLFGTLGARRLEAESHGNHAWAHRWLQLCGAKHEGTREAYGKDGVDYLTFAILRPRSFDKVDSAC